MKFSILTYNLLLNDATKGVKDLVATYNPDIACFQEIDTNNHIFGSIESPTFQLADFSNTVIKFGHVYGVATFYNPQKYEYIHSSIIPLPQGVFEIINNVFSFLRNNSKQRAVLHTEFRSLETGKKIVVYNVHLSAAGTNSIRLKQLRITLNDINHDSQESIIMLGDFNYVFGRRKLEEATQEYNFREATDKIDFTLDRRLTHYSFIEKLVFKTFRKLYGNDMKNDYVFYKNCEHIETKKIDIRLSDHFPLISEFSLT
jgi:endonuclease/exonuclease/phosphatase family metal-dependent hydrolase